MDNISVHISYAEATKSQSAERLGIKNIPTVQQLGNMMFVAEGLFEPLRNWWGKPIGISSFFRSLELNHTIGGSSTSQHCLGLAVDIDADIFNNGLTNKMIFDFFNNRKEVMQYDQLIWEFGDDHNPAWVHISKMPDNKKNRVMNLKAVRENGKTVYLHQSELFDVV